HARGEGGHWPPASRNRRETSVSRQRLRLRPLSQYGAQLSAPPRSQGHAGNPAGLRGSRFRSGRQLSYARTEGDFRKLGAHRRVLRLTPRMGRTFQRGGLYRRLLLDHYRLSVERNSNFMGEKTYAILGGGGSFGIHAAFYLLDHANPKKVIGIGRNPLRPEPFSLGI